MNCQVTNFNLVQSTDSLLKIPKNIEKNET